MSFAADTLDYFGFQRLTQLVNRLKIPASVVNFVPSQICQRDRATAKAAELITSPLAKNSSSSLYA